MSSIWRIEQKTEGEENKDSEWRGLINDYIHMNSILTNIPMNSILPAPALSHCRLRSQNPDYHSGEHPRPPPQRTAAIRAHKRPANSQLPFRQLLPSSPVNIYTTTSKLGDHT